MNELAINVFESKGKIFTNTRAIASETKKRHDHVLVTISKILKRTEIDSPHIAGECFVESLYLDSSGRSNKEYLLTKKGFLLYVFSIEGYEDFKMAYIERFDQMEKFIREKQSTEWLETRKMGKLVRRNETDSIQDFILYARSQGSQSPEKYYVHFTKLVNSVVGINTGEREFCDRKVLDCIANIEDMILNTVREQMALNVYYKDIYKLCKQRAEDMIKYFYLPERKLLKW